MDTNDNLKRIVEYKKLKGSIRKPKYATRKLSIGLVSCMLGYALLVSPSSVEAAAETTDQVVEDKATSPEEDLVEESSEVTEKTVETDETKKEPVTYNDEDLEGALPVSDILEGEPQEESPADVKEEFKLTDEEKARLKEADFTEAEIEEIEKEARSKKEADESFDLESFLDKKIADKKLADEEAKKADEDKNSLEVSEDGADKKEAQKASINKARAVATREAAPPEDTTTSADAKDAVHGYVGVLVGGDINADLKAETGQRFKPIEGVKVYFQWYEAKGNRTSPTYYAVSGADGQFHIKMKPYIGEDGKLVKFDADTTVSAGKESYKMWVDESTIPEGYQLQYSTGEGVQFTDRKVAGGDYQLGPNRLVNYRVLLMKKQDEAKMHKEATPTGPQIFADPVGNVGQGAVRGKVSWDYESAGGVQWGIVSTPTSPAEGVTVTASYLSDYALKQIYSADTAKMLGLSKPSDIRGSGWTFKLETQLQEWIAQQVAADKDKWIAETVSAVTNAEGDYKIQFKGTWGPKWNDESVANYTPPRTWSEEEKARLGTVAENAKDGSFLSGALSKNEKHINSNWLFISTKDTDDVVKRTPWNYNWYTGSNNAWGIHGGWAQAAFGVSTVQAAHSTRADFNLAPAEIKFNITNFDTQANTATPGDVAVTNTAGLPYKNTNDSFKIVWYDQNGKKIKEEPTQNPTSTGALAEGTFDTKDVTETKTFIAKLHYVDSKGNLGQVLAQDAFTVKISKLVVSAHDEVSIANPGASDDSMKGATYSAEGLPKGLTIDPNNGTISGKATTPGKYTVTVKTSVPDEDSGEPAEGTSQYVALVTDSPLKDGNINSAYSETIKPLEAEGYVFKNVTAKFIGGKEIDGLTITGDQISGTPTVKVDATQEDPNVEVTYDIYKLNEKGEEVLIKKGHVDRVPLSIKDGETTNYEPKYEAVDGKVGTEATVKAPTFTDKDGKPATPKNVTYELGEGAPTGAKVNADGSVTYTPVDGDAGNTVNIPVVVKYSDGTTDNVNAVINVVKNATTADKVKELGGLNPQTIKVWKGDDIDWHDGVVAADSDNSEEVRKLLEAATITDKAGRNSNEAGKSEGTLSVTFADGSSIDLLNQKLIVSDHVVVIDPNNTDPDAIKESDLPKGAIPVKFVGKTGVSKVNTNGVKTYAKKGTTLDDQYFPTDITFKDGYGGPVTWSPADHKVTNNAPYYDKRGIFTFRASATLLDIIDRTNNPDAPTPDGYVRVTFTNGDGVNDIENTKVYDVKEGVALPADKYPEVTAKEGYENPTWSVEPGTAITADNATITATATQKAPEQTTADKLTPSYEDKDGKAGEAVTTDAPAYKDADGKTTTAPEGTKYALGKDAPKGATIDENTGKVTYKPKESEAGKPVEIPVVVTYPDKSTDNAKAKITVAKLDDIIDRTNNPDAPTPDGYVRVTFTNGDGVNDIENTKVYDVKEGVALPAEKYPEVTAKDGYENPTWSTAPGTAISKDNATITATATKVKETSAKPKINQPKSFDTTVTGTATPGATVEVTLPNGEKKTTTADQEGNWTVETPKLEKDTKITAKATEENKKPSEDTTQTVSSWQSLFDAKTEDFEVARGTDVKAHDVYERVKLIFKENGKEFVVGEDNRILLPIGDDSHAWLVVNSKTLPTKDSVVGEYTQRVTINYPDGSTEIVEVVVRVKDSNADTHTPTGKDIIVKKGETPKAEDAITNKDDLPKGTKYEWKETPDTSKTGETTGTVVVTYPDGSTDEVEVKITVTEKPSDEKIADKVDPTLPEKTEVEDSNKLTEDEKNTVKDKIEKANKDKFPEGTKVEVDEKGNATITYPDGSTDTIPAKDLVVEKTPAEKDADKYEPTGKDVTAEKDSAPKAEDAIENKDKLPEGTKYAWKETPDTSKAGETTGTVVVTYPDGSKDEVEVKITVTEKDADKYEPTVEKEEVEKGGKVDLTDNVTNLDKLPEGTTVKDVTPEGAIDTETPGDYTGKVEVTYPDGSTEIVDVPVKVKDTTPAEKDADKYDPEVSPEEVEKGGKVDLTDNVTNLDKLPEGTTVKDVTPEGTIDTETPGDYTGKVEVTYPDGSTEIVDVPVKVKDTTPAEKDADKYDPTVEKEEVEKGGKVDLTDNVTNLDKLPEGTKVEDVTPEGAIDTETPGDYTGKIKVTYPDGSTEIVDVPVKVKDTTPAEKDADKYEPAGKDITVKKGETPKAEDAITNKDDLPEGTKYEWKETPDTSKTGETTGTVVVTYPDGSTDEVEVKITVTEKPSDEKIADKVDPNLPEKTEVKDSNKLTDDEKKTVKDKIEKANKDKFPEGTKVEVDDKGNATITYPDGSTDTIPAKDLVVEKPSDDKKIADKVDPTLPEKKEVKDANKLTEDEKNTVKDKIEKANKDKFPEGTKVEVDEKGNATITYPDGSTDTIPAKDLVTEKDKGTSTPDLKDSEKNVVVTPKDKTGVVDKNNLTDKERAEIADKVKKANPEVKEVVVDKKGNATLIYKDGSENTIPADKLVYEIGKVKVPSQQTGNKDNKNSNNSKAKTGSNVKTGVESLAGVAATLAAAASGIFATRKKKEDEE